MQLQLGQLDEADLPRDENTTIFFYYYKRILENFWKETYKCTSETYVFRVRLESCAFLEFRVFTCAFTLVLVVREGNVNFKVHFHIL